MQTTTNHVSPPQQPVGSVSPGKKLKRLKRGECAECGTRLMSQFFKKPVPGKCGANGRCLVCVPLTAQEQQKQNDKRGITGADGDSKTANPVPKLLICQTKQAGILLEDLFQATTGSSLSLTPDLENHADIEDNISALTLDRRIWTNVADIDQVRSVHDPSYVADSVMILDQKNDDDKNNAMIESMANLLEESLDNVRATITKRSSSMSSDVNAATLRGSNADGNSKAVGSNKAIEARKSTTGQPAEIVVHGIADEPAIQQYPISSPRRASSRVSQNSQLRKKVFQPASMFVPPTPIATSALGVGEQSEIKLEANVPPNGVVKDLPKNKATPEGEIFSDSGALSEKKPTKNLSSTASESEDVSMENRSSSSHNIDDMDDEYDNFASNLLLTLDSPYPAASTDVNEIHFSGAIAVPSDNAGGGSVDGDEDESKPRSRVTVGASLVPSEGTLYGTSHVPSEETIHGSNVPEFDLPVSPKQEEFTPTQRKKPPPPSPRKPPPVPPLPVLPDVDVGELLQLLQNSPTPEHPALLEKLTQHLWQDESHKVLFAAVGGVETLTTILWTDMGDPVAERAAANLFLALVAQTVAPPSTTTVAKAPARNGNDDSGMEALIDAMLITMQTLLLDIELQQIGCRVLSCLAIASSENDGTRSGACLAVLNAMVAHPEVGGVREWGLRALYSQCVYSKHSEMNKHTLLSSKLEGTSGREVLEQILLSKNMKMDGQLRSGGPLEWVCRLLWCLTASNDAIVDLMPLNMDVLRTLLHLLEHSRVVDEPSAHLQEAVLGMIANISRMQQFKSFLGASDVILLVLDTMHGNKDSAAVQIEACNAIANIAVLLSPQERNEVVDSGAIRTIVGAMFAFPDEKAVLQEPGLRALVGLADGSEMAKEAICDFETFSVLMRLCRLHEGSTPMQQEMLCSLLATLYASGRLQSDALQSDSLGALKAAVRKFCHSEKIQDASCAAVRNLSKNKSVVQTLLRGNTINLVVNAMAEFRYSRSIQINGCCALWNIGAGTEFDIGLDKLAATNAMEHIVNAIQVHLETYDVMLMACGSLWGLIDRSPRLRQQFFRTESGVESVTCCLMMHAKSPALLEKALGILTIACITPQEISPAVLATGMNNVVETMRNNPKSIELLRFGAFYLRNSITRNRNYVAESESVLTVLLNAVREFRHEDAFLREACYFIWTIAELSEHARASILVLDGLPLIRSILDRTAGTSIGNAALGAYNELSM